MAYPNFVTADEEDCRPQEPESLSDLINSVNGYETLTRTLKQKQDASRQLVDKLQVKIELLDWVSRAAGSVQLSPYAAALLARALESL